jgi:hypothetical protein
MDPAPGPSSGALALAALALDPVISRIVNCLEDREDCDSLRLVSTDLRDDERKHLRSASQDLRDACDRQVKTLRLPSETSNVVEALPCLYRLVQRGVQPETLDLSGLACAEEISDELLEALL